MTPLRMHPRKSQIWTVEDLFLHPTMQRYLEDRTPENKKRVWALLKRVEDTHSGQLVIFQILTEGLPKRMRRPRGGRE